MWTLRVIADHLSSLDLTPPALCTLAALNPNLTTLRLDYCGRMDNLVIDTWSTGLPNLTRLELLGPFLVHAGHWRSFFASHPSLEGFLITQSPRFDLDCVQALAENCKNISELRLKEIGQLSDEFLPHIAKLGDQLKYLDLSCPGKPDALSEEAVIQLMEAVGENLTHLDLSGNVGLTDGFLFQGLKPHTRHLNSLILSNVPELSDAGVAEFFNTWTAAANPCNPPLVTLDLSRNDALAGAALTAVLEHSGKTLETLSINGWKAVPQKVLETIGVSTPSLKKLDIGWCREVDDWIVKAVVEKCGHIEEIKVFGCQRLTERCPRKVSLQPWQWQRHDTHTLFAA